MLDYQEHLEEFKQKNNEILSATTDALEKASSWYSDLKLDFGMAYGLDTKRVSTEIGAHYNAEQKHLHATGILINPFGTVAASVYSPGTKERLKVPECLEIINRES